MTTIRLRSRRKNFLTASRISSYFKHKLGLLWKVFMVFNQSQVKLTWTFLWQSSWSASAQRLITSSVRPWNGS
jgi:hypothetical protein